MDTKIPTNTNQKLHTMMNLSMLISILCIIGPIVIPLPISPIPISLTTLGLYLGIHILGYKQATIATLIYIILGFIGLPIFSGYTGGPHTLLGPTGGYIIGYIPMTYITGLILPLTVLAYPLGLLSCYLLGTLWLSYITHIPYQTAIFIGVLPYLLVDILKIIIAHIVFPKISRILNLQRH